MTELRNLFVTQNFPPVNGGMARRHAELVNRYGEAMEVSTIARSDAAVSDAAAAYPINRQPFELSAAKRFSNEVRWGQWLARRCCSGIDVLHCGEIRPVGYAVWWAHWRSHAPYVIYVNGGDLLRERQKSAASWSKRISARRMFGDAAGIIANSGWTAEVAREVMRAVGVERAVPVAAIELGTNPERFNRKYDIGALRAKLGVAAAPIMLTVARLVPHKGQDVSIRAMAALQPEFPNLQYLIVGAGDDEKRLRAIASTLSVGDRVHFLGQLDDSGLAEAYATSSVYVGLSRIDRAINVEGFGISFVEASSSATPVVAGDSGGVRSAVRDGVTGLLVPPEDVGAAAAAIGAILRDLSFAQRLGAAGRDAVETHYNWDRVAAQTREFIHNCTANRVHTRQSTVHPDR